MHTNEERGILTKRTVHDAYCGFFRAIETKKPELRFARALDLIIPEATFALLTGSLRLHIPFF